MEQPTQPGGENLTDEQRIYHHIVAALLENRPIDHSAARAIAAQLHGGQDSALYVLASSGALPDGLRDELDGWRRDDTPVEIEPWLDALDEYLDSRAEQPGAIDGWSDLWPGGPNAPPVEQADDEAEARQALFERVSAAGVTTLGQIATVGAHDQQDQDDGPDTFPWVDAATWSPAEDARSNEEEPRYSSEELDTLFIVAAPDEEIGSVDELGWYGLVRHDGRPGGLILIQDEQGFRHVREAPDDAALDAQWAAIQAEYATFYEQRDAYELVAAEVSNTLSGQTPRIWVGSLSDYNNGRVYGVWMDATLEPDELHSAVQFMLRTGGTPGAEEWAIFDHEDFGGYEVSQRSSFATVSLIAQGVADHGAAYAAWVNYVGDSSGELLEPERFRDHYLGEWNSLEEYVEDVLQETGFYERLDGALEAIPEDLRQYVKVDVEGIAEKWKQGLYMAEASSGRMWVFDARN